MSPKKVAKKISRSRGQKGFTLIELLVYIATLVIIIGAIVVFSIIAIRSGSKIKANAEVLDNARRAMEIMTYEIKKSRAVYSPTSKFDINPGQLSLEQTAGVSNETIGFVDFFQCGEGLCLKREGNQPINFLSGRVKATNLKFEQLINSASAVSIQITLRVESTVSSDYMSGIELTNTALLRGY